MRALPHVSLILGMVVFLAADDAKKKKQSDYDKLQGMWVTGESWKDGEREAKDAKEPEVYRFVNRTVEFGTLVRGKFVSVKKLGPFTGPLKLDESKSPKHMTVTFEGTALFFVYSLKGDTLKIGFFVEDLDFQRPKTLPGKGKKGKGLFVATLTRVQPKKP